MRMRRPYQGKKQLFAYGFVAAGIFVLLLLSLSLLEKVTATTVQLQNDNGEAAGYSGTISSCRVFGSVLQASADQYPLRLLSAYISHLENRIESRPGKIADFVAE